MSSLSRTFRRAAQRRGDGLMEKHQPAGVYKEAEKKYNEAQKAIRARRAQLKEQEGCVTL